MTNEDLYGLLRAYAAQQERAGKHLVAECLFLAATAVVECMDLVAEVEQARQQVLDVAA